MADSIRPIPGLAWHLSLPPRLPVIQADPIRLRQIVLNLLSNARKFTEAGEIVLGAEVAPPHLHLWVRDTGYGIPIDRQEHVFEPFFTEGYTNQRPEGIGLGLTITRQLVALHGGSLVAGEPAGAWKHLPYLPASAQPERTPPSVPPCRWTAASGPASCCYFEKAVLRGRPSLAGVKVGALPAFHPRRT